VLNTVSSLLILANSYWNAISTREATIKTRTWIEHSLWTPAAYTVDWTYKISVSVSQNINRV